MTTRRSVFLVGVVVLAGLGAAVIVRALRPPDPVNDRPNVQPGPPWFVDVTNGSGLAFTSVNGAEADHFSILETLGSGVALLDYDRDGRLDVFLVGGGTFDGPDKKSLKGQPCKLFRNEGDWKFRDVTKDVSLDGVAWWYTHGAAVADYDRDGWPDLLVTGYGRLALFRNDGGKRFVDVTEQLGLKDGSWSTSAGWADLDGDGYPDLYVCHYVDWSFANNPSCPGYIPGVERDVCPPQRFKPLVHALFRNDAGKRFQDVSAAQHFKAAGCGLGVVLVDVNNDAKPDVYVANDATNNFLFLNRTDKALALDEVGFRQGVAVDANGKFNGSMGVDAGDYDGSGRASLWVTNFQGDLHALYRNLGAVGFDHRSLADGIGAIGQHYVGFGTGFLDADNDGWEDLVVVNGHVVRWPSLGSTHLQKPVLLRNVEHEKRRFFRGVGGEAGPFFDVPAAGRGLAIGDLDNDGWPDLCANPVNSPVVLLRNEVGKMSKANWLGLTLKRRDRRDAVGATVVVEAGERRLTRFVKGGGSYLSANDPRLLFGLGDWKQPVKVTVRWSWGGSQTWDAVAPGAYWELREGERDVIRSAAQSASASVSDSPSRTP